MGRREESSKRKEGGVGHFINGGVDDEEIYLQGKQHGGISPLIFGTRETGNKDRDREWLLKNN